MMKKILILAIGFFAYGHLLADDFGDILQQIEQNNTTLRAVRDGVEAEKAENHTGMMLADPEVEYAHYWGAPTSIGARNDISISQTLDFATVFGVKRQMARSKDELAEINYDERRMEVLLEASQLLVDVVFYNRCLSAHYTQQQEIKCAVELSEKAFAAGRINRLEVNKSRLALADVNATVAEEEMKREEALLRLKQLNGGCSVTLEDTAYSVPQTMVRGRIAVNQQREAAHQRAAETEVRMAKSQSIPQLTVGYASELTRDEKFRGFTVGMSVPLWSNKNNVRRAKALQQAVQSEQQDIQFRIQSEYENQKARTERLRQYALTLAGNIPELSSKAVLHAAFERGDISALDYFQELTADFELQHKAMLAERDYQQALVVLAWY